MGWLNKHLNLDKEAWGMDWRTMFVLRVWLGLVGLCDSFVRYEDICLWFSDEGVSPRHLFIPDPEDATALVTPHPEWLKHGFSILNASGSCDWVMVIFWFNIAASCCFIVGYNTRLAGIFLWIYNLSLRNRNMLVFNGGNEIFRLILFFCMFLPMGKRSSVDHVISRGKQSESADSHSTYHFSVAVVALRLQMAYMYFVSGIHKNGETWLNGTALSYTLLVDSFVKPLGVWLRQFPALCKFLTHFTLVSEFVLPPLVMLCNSWVRTVVTALLVSFHIGITACLSLDLFPYYCCGFLSLYLPRSFWEWLTPYLLTEERKRSIIIVSDSFASRSPWGHFLLECFSDVFLVEGTGDFVSEKKDDHFQKELDRARAHWGFVNSKGLVHTGTAAIGLLLAHSPAFFFAGPLVRLTGRNGPAAQVRKPYQHRPRPAPRVSAQASSSQLDRVLNTIRNVTCTVVILWCLAYVTLNNIERLPPVYETQGLTCRVSETLCRHGVSLGLDQNWQLFAPNPPLTDVTWVMIQALEQNGHEKDLFVPGFKGGKPLEWTPAPAGGFYLNFSSEYWRSYVLALYNLQSPKLFNRFAAHLCNLNPDVRAIRMVYAIRHTKSVTEHDETVFMSNFVAPCGSYTPRQAAQWGQTQDMMEFRRLKRLGGLPQWVWGFLPHVAESLEKNIQMA